MSISCKYSSRVLDWWKKNTNSFLFPVLYAAHTHEWESIEFGVIGCRLCGVLHCCSETKNIIPCNIEIQKDCSSVCIFTGFILNTTMLVDQSINVEDYTRNTHRLCTDTQKYIHVKNNSSEVIATAEIITRRVFQMLLYSQEAKKARKYEHLRFKKKILHSLTVSLNKRTNNLFGCDIFNAIEYSFLSVKQYRIPPKESQIPPPLHWDTLIRNIALLITRLNIPKPYKINLDGERIRNLVVATIYMSVRGIHEEGYTFLKSYPLLQNILPLELMLWSCMNIQSKIVTEGENIIKRFINLNKQNLVKHDFIHEKACNFSMSNVVCSCVSEMP